MTTLTLSTGSFDQENTFTIAHPRAGRPAMRCALYQGYGDAQDGVYWAMQIGACLKAAYTDADIAERERLAAMTPLANGELVQIDGQTYRTVVQGDFSDAAIFRRV